jgi:hypothetical protein
MLRCEVFGRIVARVVARIVAGVGVCAATLLLAAASAQATPAPGSSGITCGPDMSIEGKEVVNNVTVPPGDFCNLVRGEGRPTTVDGNVTVGKDGHLIVFASVIKGNLSTEGAEQVQVIGSVVEDNASFDATSDTGTFFCPFATVCLLGSAFGGNVSITKTSPAGALIAKSFIARDLSCKGNASVTNAGFKDTVLGQEFGQCLGL